MQQSSRGGAHHIAGAPVFNVPLVVALTIGLLVLCHFAIILSPKPLKIWLQVHGAVSPKVLLQAVGQGKVLRGLAPLIAHVFLHANIAHLAMNCVWLLAFGAPVARHLAADRAGIGGGVAFLLLFVLSGVFGGIAYVAVHPGDYTLLVGASGGVSGLLGGLVRFAFQRGSGDRFASLTDRNVIVWSAAIVFLNLAVGFLGGFLFGNGADIAWEAHLGGYLFGLLAFPLFDSARAAR